LIRAAGGVVVRDGRVLLVHRPAYDDWTLPKGKLELDETWEHAALREVAEETNLSCVLDAELGQTHYVDRGGREKEVRYFLMHTIDEPEARNEIDEVRWVLLADAPALLSYERDAELLSQLSRLA
jgi:8-oxo-dGTP pyrophosphatase MutT (NUDIX family)